MRGYGSAKYSTVSYSGVIKISFIVLVLVLEKREPGRKVLAYLDFGLNGVSAVRDGVRISSHDRDNVGA